LFRNVRTVAIIANLQKTEKMIAVSQRAEMEYSFKRIPELVESTHFTPIYSF